MILNNFSNLCACLNQNPGYYQRDMGFIDATNQSPTFSSGYSYVTPNNGGVSLVKITTHGQDLTQTPVWFILLGKGTTQPTPSDYNLETAIEGVSYTAGLDVVCTAPSHGPAFDRAGKGTADETSFMQAIFTAVDITRHRACYDTAHATPLPHHNIQHEKPAGERKRFPAEAQ